MLWFALVGFGNEWITRSYRGTLFVLEIIDDRRVACAETWVLVVTFT
jgi:hypothetical protein